MRRVLQIGGAILGLLLTIAIVVFVLIYTGILRKEDIDLIKVYEYTTDDNLIYTEAEWDWKAYENRDTIQYEEGVSIPTKTVVMNIDNTTFYNVTIPDKPYIYDYGKTIWAEDGTFVIRIIGNGSLDNLSSLAGIDNGINVNQLTITSQEKIKGRRTVATLVGESAIVADIYGSNEDYSIIRDSIASNHETYDITTIPYSDNCVRLSELKYVGSYAPQVILSDISISQNRKLFKDGSLWTSSMVEPYYKTKNIYLAKLVAASDGVVEEIYDDGKVLFARSGNYYIGVISYNTNTCIVMIGEGEEAYCNIVSVISLER